MTAPTEPSEPSDVGGGDSVARCDEPIARLRGAGVDVDARRAGRVAAALAVLALLGTGAGLAAGAASRNAEIEALRSSGVPVTITVSGCRGLLGGSGSNLAGYSCQGSYRLDHRAVGVTVPDGKFHAPGSKVAAIAASSQPGLVASPAELASERASAKAFLLPLAFISSGLVAGAALLIGGRRRARRSVAVADRARGSSEAGGSASGRPATA